MNSMKGVCRFDLQSIFCASVRDNNVMMQRAFQSIISTGCHFQSVR